MRFKTLAVGLAAVLAFGCTDQATSPTALDDLAVAPTFNFLNGPANPGNSGVVRFEDGEWFLGQDVEDELFSSINLGVPLNDSFVCTEAPFDPELTSYQEFFAAGALHQHIKGTDVTIEVVPFDWECGDPPTAFGYGKLEVTDNDFFVSGTRTNSFGYRAHGQLTDPVTGQRVNYSETFKAIITKEGEFRVLVENIKLAYPGGN